MERELENYLEAVERHLKAMPLSERVDVVKELKSYIEELQLEQGKTPQQIIAQLGTPKELAGEYLRDSIAKAPAHSLRKILMSISFYGLVGLSGMFIIPCFTVLAGGLYFSAVIAPLAGLIGAGAHFLGFDLPFVVMNFGSFALHPYLALPVSILFGALFFVLGRLSWKLVTHYIQTVSKTKKKLIEQD